MFPFFPGTMTTLDRRSHSQFAAQAALFVLFSGLPGHCYCFVCFWDLVFLRCGEVINLLLQRERLRAAVGEAINHTFPLRAGKRMVEARINLSSFDLGLAGRCDILHDAKA